MSIASTWQQWWTGHGTKILGWVTVLIGAGGESLSLIQAVDQKHSALWALIIGLGGAVIRRGFTNTARTNSLPSPDPNATR